MHHCSICGMMVLGKIPHPQTDGIIDDDNFKENKENLKRANKKLKKLFEKEKNEPLL